MGLAILGIILVIIAFIMLYKAQNISFEKQEKQERYKEALQIEINKIEKQAAQQKKKLDKIKQENCILIQRIRQREKSINQELQSYKEEKEADIEGYIEAKQALAEKKVREIEENTAARLEIIKQKNIKILNEMGQEKTDILQELEKIKASLSAGVAARLREQEKKDKIGFYKLSVSSADLNDIQILNNLKPSLRKSVILSKYIWTQYFQKQMNELCERVLGKKTACGIYKITNLTTEQCYIGQSRDIATRWKDHCKCGLGIDAPATNALYNAMQESGVWNFSFELLEECSPEQLNEKEKFWIEMYQSKIFGYNTTKGGS